LLFSSSPAFIVQDTFAMVNNIIKIIFFIQSIPIN
jgi:hypothetical protein